MARKQGFDGIAGICPVHDPQGERADSMMGSGNVVNSEVSDAAHWEHDAGLESKTNFDELNQ